MSQSLEVSVNLSQNYMEGDAEKGRIYKTIAGEIRSAYMSVQFGKLLEYVLKGDNLDSEQQSVRTNIQAKMKNSSDQNLIIKLYDENDEELEGEFSPGEIHINDVVSDKIDKDVSYIKMGISTSFVVG